MRPPYNWVLEHGGRDKSSEPRSGHLRVGVVVSSGTPKSSLRGSMIYSMQFAPRTSTSPTSTSSGSWPSRPCLSPSGTGLPLQLFGHRSSSYYIGLATEAIDAIGTPEGMPSTTVQTSPVERCRNDGVRESVTRASWKVSTHVWAQVWVQTAVPARAWKMAARFLDINLNPS